MKTIAVPLRRFSSRNSSNTADWVMASSALVGSSASRTGGRCMMAPEIADYSVSAILVEPDAVWMGIFQSGEYGGSPAGILRYDRKTQTIRKYELPDAGYGLD